MEKRDFCSGSRFFLKRAVVPAVPGPQTDILTGKTEYHGVLGVKQPGGYPVRIKIPQVRQGQIGGQEGMLFLQIPFIQDIEQFLSGKIIAPGLRTQIINDQNIHAKDTVLQEEGSFLGILQGTAE